MLTFLSHAREGGSRVAAIESRATVGAVVAFVLGGGVTALLMIGKRLPLAGPASLGSVAAWLSAAAAGVSFAAAFLLETRRGRAPWRDALPWAKRAFDFVVLTVATAMLSYLGITAIANLFQLGFVGLTVDSLGGGVLSGAAVAAVAYVAALAGSRVTAEGIAMLATVQLFMGTMTSMVTSADATWWQLHFSQLGNEHSTAGIRFNVALILTGFVLTVLANHIGYDLQRGLAARGVTRPRLVAVLTWLFAGIGICMAMAGVVPDATNIVIHVGSASGMLLVFAAFTYIALRQLVAVPKDLVVFSIIVAVGIVVAVLLWVPFGYYNLTGTEFTAASLLFAWLMVFVRSASAYAAPGARDRSGHGITQ